ncbi:MAG TPA: hypothetical protein VEO95_08685 [Chthoniobacteraceae bacterium]|nr:hypothetical protein [Chthoniobacteraceae bacterium]
MPITKQTVAKQLVAYLQHELSLRALVDWAERAMMDGEFDNENPAVISEVVARLGLADVRAFGLAWEDCEELLRKLGYTARVEVSAA